MEGIGERYSSGAVVALKDRKMLSTISRSSEDAREDARKRHLVIQLSRDLVKRDELSRKRVNKP